MSESEMDIEYGIDEQPPPLKAVLLGLQHLAVMIVPATAVAYVVGGAVGLSASDLTYTVQMVLLFSGIATVVQSYGAGVVGARLPVVMGSSFTFVGAAIAIGNNYGLATVFGSILVTGVLVEWLIGWQFKRIEAYFPPLVTGLVVLIIGLYLVPIGFEYAAGGAPVDGPQFGTLYNLGLAALVLVVAVVLNLATDGLARILSTLAAIVVGYVAAIALTLGSGLELVSFDAVGQAAWLALPQPGRFGVPEFRPVPIATFAFLFLVSAMETVGDMSGVTSAEGRNPTNEEFRGGLFTDGLFSSVGAAFGAYPITSFSQNVGIVNFTGVLSRYVVTVTGILLAVLGLSPKVGAVVTTIPSAVFGGAVLLMAGMVAASGARLITIHCEMNRRNMTVMGVSLGLGLGVATAPSAAFAQLPQWASTFFSQAVIMTGLSALLLNTFAPGTQSPLFGGEPETEPPLEEPVGSDD
ncbi:uracil-xanthine permease family protein [Halosegnis rubeus]|jgi:NCS2 family nucleobase:cation symporter-2|uniref:Purine permease n=1 Tax=Halosegnis rubeus TaxID=2212850 RepID=A0A5N5UER3_9EURY|nr:nucleobase:cation symporter-2 family protein [Halosegnis rubeus]KAB7517163.1 purine permease [Halosegnis rubeus]KAB7519716.1 purine permease [Halosegnis rubeus]